MNKTKRDTKFILNIMEMDYLAKIGTLNKNWNINWWEIEYEKCLAWHDFFIEFDETLLRRK